MVPIPVKIRPDQYSGKIIDHKRVSKKVGRASKRLPKEALIFYSKLRCNFNKGENVQRRMLRRKKCQSETI